MAQNETGELFEFDDRPVIKGYPELRWTGKRPYRSTQYFPAQLKESYGEPTDGWMNKIFWGDNLQVMSHLLKEYRGKVDLIYIDPPFDSNTDYKKKIKLKGKNVTNDSSAFEEKQYGDIWTNDDYLQFMFERLVLLRELLSSTGSLFLHCDYHRNYLLRALLDEVFGTDRFINEIVWRRKGGSALGSMTSLSNATDTIYWYSKTPTYLLNPVYTDAPQEYIDQQFRYSDDNGRRYMITVMRSPSPRENLMYDYKGYKMPPNGWAVTREKMEELDAAGYLHFPDSKNKQIYKKLYLDEYKGHAINNLWADISTLKGTNKEIVNYPTQKPEELLERIIEMASNPDDLVLDCFMGSGTTQTVAMKLGRRFIGADINLGSIQTTTKRLLTAADELGRQIDNEDKYLGFEVYNVNNYDFFRNPVEAKELLIQALDIQPFTTDNVFDGELDGRKVKILPTNRIATRADLEGLVANLPYVVYDAHKEENPSAAVDHITLVCMGHEPDLKAALEGELSEYVIDVEIVDILRDKKELEFKREAEASVIVEDGKLTIKSFYPMNLLQKLSLQKESVGDWRELVESVLVDWNYDGAVLEPAVIDIPEKNGLVAGVYDVPADAGRIKVKITDVLSESLEVEVE